MRNIALIFSYTLRQHLRHRIYLTVGLFGLVLLAGSFVISSLAVEEQGRMLVDLGLAAIELLALLSIVFVTVNLILEEVESRSITLILTHPVRRSEYVLGRFLGTLFAVAAGMAAMGALHAALLALHGWPPGLVYGVAWICSLAKIAVVGALALLLSLFSTSAPSAMTLTVFFWILGHFSEELRFLGEKSGNGFVRAAVWIVAEVTPNFAYFNYRDFWSAPVQPSLDWFGWTAVYTFSYAGVCLFLSTFLFQQKEF